MLSFDRKEILQLYFIMGSNNTPHDPVWLLEEAIRGGITAFQFREKDEGAKQGEERADLAKRLKAVCQEHSLPFLVDDDVDLALSLDADGVHIGQEDERIDIVRSRIGWHKILGVSAHTLEEALTAQELGADYIGVGPIYETDTKREKKAAISPFAILQMREAGVSIPIVGIGGIHPGNAAHVIAAGGDGIAVISAIARAKNPRQIALTLRQWKG